MLTISAERPGGRFKTRGLQVQRVSGAMLHRFAPSIEIVLDECFRTPGYEREVFASMARRQDPVVWIAMDVEGMVIAFLGGFLIDAGQASREPRIPPSRMPVSIVSTDRAGDVGVMETICVRSRWQRQGIGSRLIGLAEQDIDDQGARVIAIPGWKVGNRVNIGRAAVRCGYAHALTVAKLWAPECAAG